MGSFVDVGGSGGVRVWKGGEEEMGDERERETKKEKWRKEKRVIVLKGGRGDRREG